MPSRRPLLWGYLVGLTLLKGVTSIRLISFSVPDHAIQGEDVELVCNYDLEGDKLYSVKWYRNAQEFYRYIPTDSPSTAAFRLPGLMVNEYRSTETNIVLRRVDLMTTGLFRCEVSGEAPLFQTASQEKVLVVVNLPDSGPIITGSQPRYQIGDTLSVSCTSPNSRPAAKLRWYINGEDADPSLLSPHHINKSVDTGLETSQLDLRFRLTEKHFRRAADLKLKCTATIATIYWRSNEEAVQIVRKQTEYSQYRSQIWSPDTQPMYKLSRAASYSAPSFLLLLTLLMIL